MSTEPAAGGMMRQEYRQQTEIKDSDGVSMKEMEKASKVYW